jgi:hypothetical protein
MRTPIDVYILIPIFVKLIITIFPTRPIGLFLLQNGILLGSLLITNFIHHSMNSDICKEKNLSVNYFKRFIKSGSDAFLLHAFGVLATVIVTFIPPLIRLMSMGAKIPFGSNIMETLIYSIGMILAYVIINISDSTAYTDAELCSSNISYSRFGVSFLIVGFVYLYQFLANK